MLRPTCGGAARTFSEGLKVKLCGRARAAQPRALAARPRALAQLILDNELAARGMLCLRAAGTR